MKQTKYDDTYFMEEALLEAQKGIYTTHPNPRVGCVFVIDNKIVARGFTQKTGQAHAEVNAIENRTTSLKDSTCYVTLEPCSHIGLTGACATALIEQQIKRCVVAIEDPNPVVDGRGIDRLTQAGIEVTVGVLKQKAYELNQGFFKRMQQHIPQVIAKVAASLDGKTAMDDGQSQWITHELSRQDAHELRAQVGAIITSYKTVNLDNAKLTARINRPEILQPLRVIVDAKLQVNPNAAIFSQPGATLIAVADSLDSKTVDAFKQQLTEDAQIVSFESQDGHINLMKLLNWLAQNQINQVMIEAGRGLLGAFLNQNLVDELVYYMAPKILGSQTQGMFDLEIASLAQHVPLTIKQVKPLGQDIKITASVGV